MLRPAGRAAPASWLLLALAGVVSGCSVDGVGFATAEIIRAEGAVVVVRTTWGAALRTGAEDAGLAIGYTRTLTVAAEPPDAPAAGPYPLGAGLPDLPAAAVIRRMVGIDIGVNRRMVGIVCGASEDAVLAMVPGDASMARRLVLTPDDPAATQLHLCREPDRCNSRNF